MKSVKNIIVSIAFFATIITGLYIIYNDSDLRNKAFCEKYNKYLILEFSTSLQDKFLNTNSHMRPTIKVNDIEIDISLDNSGLYESILIGDSLVKVRGNPKVDVFRNEVLYRTFNVDFQCVDR